MNARCDDLVVVHGSDCLCWFSCIAKPYPISLEDIVFRMFDIMTNKNSIARQYILNFLSCYFLNWCESVPVFYGGWLFCDH